MLHSYPFGVLIVSWALWLWDSYLGWRQYKVYVSTDKVPDILKDKIDHETFIKSKRYSIDKARFGILSGLFGQIQTTATISLFLLPVFWSISGKIMSEQFGLSRNETTEWEIFQTITFLLITSIVTTLINLPFNIYSTFVIEERHGFNKQTPAFYIKDQIKSFVVNFCITTPIMAAMVYITRNGGPYFFLYLWIMIAIVTTLFVFFHGEIAAIFDTFTPLREGELRTKIEEIAQNLKFPLSQIFIVEGSKRSSHSNAYQGGIFNKKRIVIYDTLIEGYYDQKKEESSSNDSSDKLDGNKASTSETSKAEDSAFAKKGCKTDEIIAIVCHELGHWALSHIPKNFFLLQANFLVIFLVFSKFYQDSTFYAAFGFPNEKPVAVGFSLLSMLLAPYSELYDFIHTSLTRHFEYQADEFAAKVGHVQNLKQGLIKLSGDNLSFPVYDELYSKFNHSHPTLLQRLDALDKKIKVD